MPAPAVAPLLTPDSVAKNKTEIIPVAELPSFQNQLLAWFAGAKRDLDWRRTRDPYRVWISEIMLQQTRVAAVLPYYRRFLERFPSVDALARARSESVLRAWAGLGYYSRARNLHRAAKEIAGRYRGEFPREMEEVLALPGIGNYTAAAVLSIAYGEPHAVLDGNVARVLARLGVVRGDLRQTNRWRKLAAAANRLLPVQARPNVSEGATAAGDWNQAMMELGATVCRPRAPQCAACPVARWCRAHALGIALRFPAKRLKPKPVRITLSAAILLDPRGRTLLVRQKNDLSGLFSNLWHFPAVKAAKPAPGDLARHLKSAFGVTAPLEPLPPARHTVTFRRILLAPYLVRVAKLPPLESLTANFSSRSVCALPLAEIERLPASSATKKIVAAARILLAR